MSTQGEPPGYTLDERIGGSSGGEVWRGRDDAGDAVRLTRLRGGHGLARDRLRRDAAVLSSVAGEHVLRVRDVVPGDDDGELWLVADDAARVTMADLLATRGSLSAPEVVTLVGRLATGLAAAHDRGLVHGDIGPETIVFTGDGRPMLADFGVGAADAAGDVLALCAVATAALAEEAVPAALRAALAAGAAADPFDRPTARELSVAVLRAGAAAPIRVPRPPEPAPTTGPPTGNVSAAERPTALLAADRSEEGAPAAGAGRVRLAVAAAVVLFAAVVGGVAWGRQAAPAGTAAVLPQPAASRPASTAPVAATTSWLAVVAALDRTRAAAFDTGDERLLRAVYAPGAPALAADIATLRRFDRAGLHVHGFTLTPMRVQTLSATRQRAVLAVTDTMSAYALVDGSGRVVRAVPRRAARTWTMTLVRVGARWLVASVSR